MPYKPKWHPSHCVNQFILMFVYVTMYCVWSGFYFHSSEHVCMLKYRVFSHR